MGAHLVGERGRGQHLVEPARPCGCGAGRGERRDRARGPDVVVWEAEGLVDKRVGYGAALASRLAADGFGVTTVPLTERPPNAIELSAPVHVLSGGNTGVDAAVGWLAEARVALAVVLERARAGDAVVTGICFGSQLIADVLAGPAAVWEHPAGIQVGLVEAYEVAGHTAGPAGSPHVVSSFHYHGVRRAAVEAVGGRVVIDSERTEVQAFEVGVGVRGVQFHPELTPRSMAATVRANVDAIGRYGGCPRRAGRSILAGRRHWSDGLWRRFVADPAAEILRRRACRCTGAGAAAA
ncbi:MAG: glutamine amidotransferase-related protein [Acidimicrobiales bacterium]